MKHADASQLVIMGRIVAPYGVFGWLKVLPETEVFDGLLDYKSWFIGKVDVWQEYSVAESKLHNEVLAVKLNGIDDRDAAFACKGKQVAVPKSSLPKLKHNEYYWSDLIGLSVKNQQATEFGLITDVFATGANDVIIVNGDNLAINNIQRERLIPFTPQVIIAVDIKAKTMLVDWDAEF